MLGRIVKVLFFALVVNPLVFVILGLNVIGRKNLPARGPAVIAANHNSHLDTLVLMSLYPLRQLHRIRPVGAADYFLRNKVTAWLSLNAIGIIPLDRTGAAARDELFDSCHQALNRGEVLIIFPEGSRGDPEILKAPRKGLFHLTKDREDTLVTPVVMRGLGRVLPRGEAMLVPFNCDVVIGEALPREENAEAFVENLKETFDDLLENCLTATTE